MTRFDCYSLLILAALILPIPFLHRWWKRPRIGRGMRRHWRRYVGLVRQYRKHAFRDYVSFRQARIVWFDPRLREEFNRKAHWVYEQRGKAAPKIWKQAIEFDPEQVVRKEPEHWQL